MTTRSRSLVLAGLLLFIPALALAGPNAGGTLILHADLSLVYTNDMQDPCGQANLDSCSAAVTSVAWDPGHTIVFHAIAAFPPESQPRMRGVSFGVDYDPDKFHLQAHGTCADLEVPDEGWPAPGTSLGESWNDTQTDHLREVYWFAGYAYSETNPDSTTFALIPRAADGGIFVDDAAPRMADSVAAFGRLGFGQTGFAPCPSDLQGGGDSSGGEPVEDPLERDGLTFVELRTTSTAAFLAGCRTLERNYGVDVYVGLPPDGVICRTTEEQRSALNADSRVGLATVETIPDAQDGLRSGNAGFAERVWNRILTAPPNTSHQDTSSKDLPAAIDTCFASSWDSAVEPGRTSDLQTSVYMLGDVSVSLVFMESTDDHPCDSTHPTENWGEGNQYEMEEVTAEVTAGLTTLAALAPDANLTFYIVGDTICPTEEEPIRSYCGDDTWQVEAMNYLGYSGHVRADTLVRTYNNDQRREYQTDWSFTLFLVRSECNYHYFGLDPNSGMYGCAAIYGPMSTVCSHPASRSLRWVVAHETSHVFGAADEYGNWSCDTTFGYLRWKNHNSSGIPGDLYCNAPRQECMMGLDWPLNLCADSRKQVGWWDRDDDGIFDPLDHPDSGTSMLIGEGDSLAGGDSVNVYTATGQWVKRLDASKLSSDHGRLLWDGIDYRGLGLEPGEYEWRRNGGQSHLGTLIEDTEGPTLSDLRIDRNPENELDAVLSFRILDADTHGSRVRATVTPACRPPVRIINDEFLMETPAGGPSIERAFTIPSVAARCDLQVLAWDVGGGQSVSDTLQIWQTADVSEQHVYAPEVRLSRGRPNPSTQWVTWDLQQDVGVRVDLSIFGVDGRRVRSWSDKELASGTTKLLWNGRDDRGVQVASGKYFLVARNGTGQIISKSATIMVR